MSMCPMCGAEVSDSEMTCPMCGGTISEASAAPTQRKRTKKGSSGFGGRIVALVLALAAAAAVIAGAVYLLIPVFNPNVALTRAFAKTGNAFTKEVRQQTELKNALTNLENTTQNQKLSLELTVDSNAYEATMTLDYNGNSKRMAGSVAYDGSGTDIELDFFANKKIIQLAIPAFSDEVYGLSTEKLEKFTKSALVSELLNTVSDTKLPSDLFEAVSDKTEGFREKWNEFVDSARVTKGNKVNGLQAYTMSWRAKDLANLVSSGAVTTLLGDDVLKILDFVDTSCVIYVNSRGYTQKIEIVVGTDLYTIELSDGKNPWSEIKIVNESTGKTAFSGGLECSSSEVSLLLENKDGDALVDISWKASSGKYTFYAFGLSFEGKLSSTTRTTEFSLERGDGTEISVKLSRLSKTPKQLAKKYVDLADMRLSDITRLAAKIAANSDAAQEALSSLYGYIAQLLN